MTNWPTASIIIITKGQHRGTSLAGAIATHTDPGNPDGGYCILTGPATGACITPGAYKNETIDAWENATVIPNHVIDQVHAAFYDINMNADQRAAFQALETYAF